MTTTARAEAMALIKQFEGCRLKAYPDPATGGIPWTIGWGYAGPDVKPGDVWTQAQADAALADEVDKRIAAVVELVKARTKPKTAGQLGAITSLHYNIGHANLRKSTLIRKYIAGDDAGAAAQFEVWNKAAGKVMAGLTRRRKAERAVFEG